MQDKKNIFIGALIAVFGVFLFAAGVWYYHSEQPKGRGAAFSGGSTSSQVFFGENLPIPPASSVSPSSSFPDATSHTANPASVFCVRHGGTVSFRTAPDGGQYGVCRFPSGGECEEWAMFRGDCPTGGVGVSGYHTPAAVYCVIAGGVYRVTKAASDAPFSQEQGICGFKNGATCDVWRFYQGTCSSTNQGKSLDCPAWVNCMPGPPDTISNKCVIPAGCEYYTQKAY